MHWLPLVAMVIASALPFPQSPVPRLVAATIEPGKNDSNSSSVPTTEISMTNSSDNRSQNNHSTHEVIPHRTDDKQSTYEEDKSRANPENLLKQDSFYKTQQDQTGGGRTTRADASRSHDHRKYRSPKVLTKKVSSPSNDILKDYQLERSQLHEESSIEAKTFLKDDRNTGNELQEKPLEGPEVSLESSRVQEDLDEDEMDSSTPEKELVKPTVGFRMEPGFGIYNIDLPEEDQLLMLDAHPRVFFSSDPSPPKHPPLLLMLEMGLLAEDGEDEESQAMDVTIPGGDKEAYRNLLLGLSDSEGHAPVRRKRQVNPNVQSRERSVCEAENNWVTDKKTAVDLHFKTVTVLQDFPTLKQPLKQFFFETKCRNAPQEGIGKAHGVEGAGCLGVDKKHWMSRCETKQSFVRAFTMGENNMVGWRWIRINSSCVCVLINRVKYNTERKGSEREGSRYR